MGKGCVRFKSLEDLALGVRFAGRELYGGRPRAVASWSREAGAAVLVKTGRPHRCTRVRGGAHGQLPGGEGAHGQGKEQRKEGRQEVRGEEGETKVDVVQFSIKRWSMAGIRQHYLPQYVCDRARSTCFFRSRLRM